MTEEKCVDKVQGALESRLEDLTTLWEAYCDGDEDTEELGNIYEYGLSFDYVEADTFKNQERGYFRYQISYGGPSEEFRFYADYDRKPHYIEFTYLDWFDGASVELTGIDKDFMLEIWNWFDEAGSVESEYQKSLDR